MTFSTLFACIRLVEIIKKYIIRKILPKHSLKQLKNFDVEYFSPLSDTYKNEK